MTYTLTKDEFFVLADKINTPTFIEIAMGRKPDDQVTAVAGLRAKQLLDGDNPAAAISEFADVFEGPVGTRVTRLGMMSAEPHNIMVVRADKLYAVKQDIVLRFPTPSEGAAAGAASNAPPPPPPAPGGVGAAMGVGAMPGMPNMGGPAPGFGGPGFGFMPPADPNAPAPVPELVFTLASQPINYFFGGLKEYIGFGDPVGSPQLPLFVVKLPLKTHEAFVAAITRDTLPVAAEKYRKAYKLSVQEMTMFAGLMFNFAEGFRFRYEEGGVNWLCECWKSGPLQVISYPGKDLFGKDAKNLLNQGLHEVIELMRKDIAKLSKKS